MTSSAETSPQEHVEGAPRKRLGMCCSSVQMDAEQLADIAVPQILDAVEQAHASGAAPAQSYSHQATAVQSAQTENKAAHPDKEAAKEAYEATPKRAVKSAQMNVLAPLMTFEEYYVGLRFLGYFFKQVSKFGRHMLGSQVDGISQPLDPRSAKVEMGIKAIEGTAFLGMSGYALWSDLDEYKNNFCDVIAAEKGCTSDKVTIGDLFHSENNIIKPVMKRLVTQNIARMGTDATFFINLDLGIFAKAFGITWERSNFRKDLSYELFRQTVAGVQSANLGEFAENTIVTQIFQAVQKNRRECKQQIFTTDEVNALTPAVERVAHHIIRHGIGINELVYIAGNGVLDPKDISGTLEKIDAIAKHGLSVFCEGQKQGKGLQMAAQDVSIALPAKTEAGIAPKAASLPAVPAVESIDEPPSTIRRIVQEGPQRLGRQTNFAFAGI